MEKHLNIDEHYLNVDHRFNAHCIDVMNYWGELLPMASMEECAELAQAISKMERKKAGKTPKSGVKCRKNLIDEIGDVLICIYSLCQKYGISDDEIDKRIEYKMGKEL